MVAWWTLGVVAVGGGQAGQERRGEGRRGVWTSLVVASLGSRHHLGRYSEGPHTGHVKCVLTASKGSQEGPGVSSELGGSGRYY